ncbi:hypothetical protein HJC99_00480 [Candidatus Saccharibacteria bacterium]|nr:hypothetical protein [Candidatus Saccharibacteria bacterium]
MDESTPSMSLVNFLKSAPPTQKKAIKLVRRRVLLAVLSVILACVALIVPTAGQAQASSCTGQTWPTTGSIQTSNVAGSNTYDATFEFSLTADQLCSLQASAPYLEIDFSLHNFSVPAAWEGYSIVDTNLPGAIHDVAYGDPVNVTSPATTRVYTAQLVAGHSYYT